MDAEEERQLAVAIAASLQTSSTPSGLRGLNLVTEEAKQPADVVPASLRPGSGRTTAVSSRHRSAIAASATTAQLGPTLIRKRKNSQEDEFAPLAKRLRTEAAAYSNNASSDWCLFVLTNSSFTVFALP
jgi:hypothetical protein